MRHLVISVSGSVDGGKPSQIATFDIVNPGRPPYIIDIGNNEYLYCRVVPHGFKHSDVTEDDD